jgi:hypothetical protein
MTSPMRPSLLVEKPTSSGVMLFICASPFILLF